MRLREICVRMPVRPFKISISCAYFSALRTASDFFNRIGRFLPVKTHPVRRSDPMQTTGEVECKWLVSGNANGWSSGMQFATNTSAQLKFGR